MQILYRPQGVFHAILKGRCYLRHSGGAEVIALEEGDVIAFPYRRRAQDKWHRKKRLKLSAK